MKIPPLIFFITAASAQGYNYYDYSVDSYEYDLVSDYTLAGDSSWDVPSRIEIQKTHIVYEMFTNIFDLAKGVITRIIIGTERGIENLKERRNWLSMQEET